ncbi:alternative ribosome rescue aminoacyl-tRNA hydrolase ArfB [Thermodesulfobacteriota bacterium]
MIRITPTISIDKKEILQEFIHASGPGGQNVNKVRSSPSLPDDVRNRLIRLGGKRITRDGVMIINARRFRTQERNRQDAIERLVELITRAAEKPRARHKTRPTIASRRRRLEQKNSRGAVKRLRRSVSQLEE